MTHQAFNPDTASESEIEARSRLLKQRSIEAALREVGLSYESTKDNKGNFGHNVERFFNIKKNNLAEPDFKAAGIELKTVPLVRGARSTTFSAKEKTFITLINYSDLAGENWPTANLRRKLQHILFVFFEYQKEIEEREWKVLDSLFWKPDADVLSQVEKDWRAVQKKVMEARAHEITATDGVIIGPSTKGAGENLTPQPFGSLPAKRRGWAFKQSYTTTIFQSRSVLEKTKHFASLKETLSLAPESDVESQLLSRLRALEGMTVFSLLKKENLNLSQAKDAASSLIRNYLGVNRRGVVFKELSERGIVMKTVPVSPGGMAYESMSFPHFKCENIVDENWEESELCNHVSRLLIIPVIRKTKKSPVMTYWFGRAFYWTPTPEQWEILENEWTTVRDLIRSGKANALPQSSQTRILHTRPHGQKGTDTDTAPSVGQITKQSFWINSAFTSELVVKHNALVSERAANA